MNSIDHVGPYDALEKAAPGEPFFVLLAHDAAAPAAITEWCRIRRNRAFSAWGGEGASAAEKELLIAELKQCAHAEELAVAMAEWRKGHATDEAPAPVADTAAVIKSAEESARADRRQTLDGACRNLREAAYHFSEATEKLRGLGLAANDGEMLCALEFINSLAYTFEARRPEFVRGGGE